MAFLAPSANAATSTVKPEGDAYVSSANPKTNFGSATELRVGATPDVRSFLRFDLTGVTGVTSARLRLYANSSSGVGYDARGATKTFNEKSVTYQNAPGVTEVVGSSGPLVLGWSSVDVTPLVLGRTAVMIAVTSTSIATISLASRESTSFSPVLEVVTDTTPPVITLTAPVSGARTRDTTPSFAGVAGTGSGDSATVTVKVYAGGTATGSPLETLTTTRDAAGAFTVDASPPLADGTYTAKAEQVDIAGNTGTSSANIFSVDSTAPVLTLAAPVNGSSTSDTTPTVSGTAGTATGDTAVVTVKIYAGTTPMGSPLQTLSATRDAGGAYLVDTSPLAGGAYTAQVEQSDAAGNVGRTAANTFSVINSAPVISLTTPGDGSVTNDSTPIFAGAAGTAPGDQASVTVNIYAGAGVTGPLVQTLTTSRAADGSYGVVAATLADGTYTGRAEQSDDTGNVGRSSPTTFRIDATPPPTPTIDSRPPNPSSSSNAIFSFSNTEASVVFLCRLDGPSFADCTSPALYTNLADGLHTFEVRARDATGNTSAVDTHTWLVDAPPRVTLTAPANGSSTADTTPVFSGVAGVDEGDSLTVSVKVYAGPAISGSPVETLTALQDLGGAYSIEAATPLPQGTYTAQAQQSDETSSGSSLANTFTVDTTPPPPPTITSGPPDPSGSTGASLAFSDAEGAAGLLCRLDAQAFADCTSPKTYAGLAEGRHTFEVKARDATGNESTATGHGWTVDATAPVLSLTSPANGSQLFDTSPTFGGLAGGASGDAATITVAVYSGTSATGTPVQTLSANRGADGTYSADASPLAQGTYSARATQGDLAGNTGQSAAIVFTIDTTAPNVTLTSPANGSSTSDTTPTLSGVAGTAPGDGAAVTVSLYAGSTTAGTPVQVRTAAAGTGGVYSVDASTLVEGTYTAQSAQTDAAGNVGRSATSTFLVTAAPPAAAYRDAVLADSPRGYWRLGESVGTTAADETANATTGSYAGGPTLGVPGALAVDANPAIRLDGVNDNASMGDPASGVLDFDTADFSVEFWLRTAVNAEQAVLSKAPGSGPSWILTVSDDQGAVGMIRARIVVGTVTRYAYGGTRVDDDRWHHVVVVFDRDSGVSIQVDGATPQFTAGTSTGSISNTGPLIVGGGGGYAYFRGEVDEVALYPTLLPSARGAAHYNTARGGPPLPVVSLATPPNGTSTSDTTPAFSGTASTQPGHATTVTVKIYGGPNATGTPVQILTATRAANGSYSVDASPLAVGQYTARAEQSDGGSNVGYSSANTFAVTAASAAVTMSQPANGSTVEDTTPMFVGQARSGNNDPRAVTIRIYTGGSVSGTPTRTATATRDANGGWAVDSSPALPAGTFTAQATQGADVSTPTTFAIVEPPPFPGTDPETLSAGDIAGCDTGGDEATAPLLDLYPNAIVTSLGDHTYDDGALSEFQNCYDPTWGRSKARTRPTVGDHEYNTPNASGYYTYFNSQLAPFGPAATDPVRGYYSYDLGSWHVITLNSNCSRVGGCGVGSGQEQWLRADLAAHPAACTLALIHHPRFSSGGSHGNITDMQAFWQALYDAGAELVLSGNDHDYERFAPQTPAAVLDVGRGLSQFVVGTGGRGFYLFANGTLKANSEVRQDNTNGVLRLKLHAGSYEWEFVPEAGRTFRDFGSRTCH